MKPGIYPNLAMHAYLALPAVSASLLQTILTECPRAAWHASWLNEEREADDPTAASDTGTIAHGILLEGSESGIVVIDPIEHPAEKTGAIPVGWTNKSIRLARDEARAAGKIPVLIDDYGAIKDMVGVAREFIESLKGTEPAIWRAFQPGGGESESTIIWQEGETLCRIRPDRLAADRSLIVDYKSTQTSPEPDAWGRSQLIRMGYYVSAAFYRRGIAATFHVEPAYAFLVQEQAPPFLCSLVGGDPHGFELGGAKIESALKQWAACATAGRWPSYPPRVCYPEIPAWEDARWEEQETGRMFTAEELAGGVPL